MTTERKSNTFQKIKLLKFGILVVAAILGYLLVKLMLTL